MKKTIAKYILIPLYAIISHVANASDDNIVIASCVENYKIEATKDGNSISKVRAHKELEYEATRTEGRALALEFYDDYIKIDKASASGAKAEYRHWIPEDIFYTDSKVCYLDIPIKKVGKRVSAVFDKTYIRGDHFLEVVFPEIYKTKSKVIKIEVPQPLIDKISIVEKSFISNVKVRTEEGKKGSKVYVYEITDMPAPKSEEDAPNASVVMPRIYIKGQYASLSDLYKYLQGLTTDEDVSLNQVKKQAMEIVSGIENDSDKIKAILAWVQDRIRYIAVEHGEYGTRPDLASEVLRKRYGDCKGMSMLLKQMLIAVGFDARLAWIGTEDVGTTWSEVPTLASGNHMICVVVDGDSTLYLDGTASYMPMGVYPPSIQGREAMIENGDAYMLKKVPIQSPSVNMDKNETNYKIENNNLCGKTKRTYCGVDKVALCATYYNVDASDRTDLLSKFITYPRGRVLVDRVEICGDSAQSLSAQIVADVVEQDVCKRVNGKMYVDLMPLRSHLLDTYDLKTRESDVLLPYCSKSVSEMSIEIPQGCQVQSLPVEYEADNEWFSASIIYTMIDDKIKCNATIELKDRLVQLNDLAKWNKCVRNFNQKNKEQIVLIQK